MLDLSQLAAAVKHENGVSRRLFLAYGASLSALPLLGRQVEASQRPPRFVSDPFKLGVASGDPTSSGVVLWTRIAPEPMEPDGGLAPEDVEVRWEVATDDAMRNIVSRGKAVATPKLAHSVHAEVDNLEPDRWYWYRFRAGDAESPIGRTRTMPAANATPDKLKLAFASCQHFESGLYTAYEHMAKEDLDMVFHLGDYIYEYGAHPGRVREHFGELCQSLYDYRARHSQYKGDVALQTMHAQCPWLVTWDDHEFNNDCAGGYCKDPKTDPVKWMERRANAYQAYYEMMPLRHTSLPSGNDMQLYRSVTFGKLAKFNVLDTRQHRTPQPYGGGRHDIDDTAMSSKGTILGADQMQWLKASLGNSSAQWNVLAQQVLMALVDFKRGDEKEYSMEKWAGYAHDRRQLMQFLEERQISNPVVLTGDIHSNWVNDLRLDDRKADTPIVATEFVGTSISSSGDGTDKPKGLAQLMSENPCVKFHNAERGYVKCTITPDEWRADYRTLRNVSEPSAPIRTRVTFIVESGKPGAVEA